MFAKTNPMVDTNIKIIEELKAYLMIIKSEIDLKVIFTENPTDFTRESKLNFECTIYLIMNMLKRSLSVEINDFFGLIAPNIKYTKAAFCLQRKKLNPLFFEFWNKLFVDSFYRHYGENVKKWKDLLLIAIDGSTTNLVNSAEVISHFGTQSNQFTKVPLARIIKYYDVLNKINIFSKISPITTGEQAIVTQNIDKLPENSLSIYDRGFPSYVLMYLHIHQERTRNFLMRCKVDFNKTVIEFMQSSEVDVVVEMFPNKKAISSLHDLKHTIFEHTTIKVRMIKVILETGETEVLLTNLYDTETYPTSYFKELYFMRWGIETSYNADKNTQQLEQFSGQSVRSIEQDFYALIFVSNLQSLIEKQCEPYLLVINSKRKHNYKVNKNVSIGSMKHKIVQLFLSEHPEKILLHLQHLFQQNIEPIRPNRNNPRQMNRNRKRGKFKTLTNYKRAI